MEKTISFEITESQAKKFERLLDKFNAIGKTENDSNKEKEISKIQTETHLLLNQAREEIEKIKLFNATNANRKKMIRAR